MFWFRLTLLACGLAALNAGCINYKSSYKGSTASLSSNANGNASLAIDPKTGKAIARGSATLTEIVLLSGRLLGQDAPFTAVAKIDGLVSTKTPLLPSGNGVKFEVSGLTAKKPGVLEVEIYAGENLRFIAKKANTDLTLKAAESNSVVIDDCQILAAPWDGLASEGGCNWVIEEEK